VTISAADVDGSILISPDEETVPFSNVTFFEVDETLHLSDVADIAVQQEAMNGVVNTLGLTASIWTGLREPLT
jgi:acetolactate decarboxylase